jgi:hypothetical protein
MAKRLKMPGVIRGQCVAPWRYVRILVMLVARAARTGRLEFNSLF